MGYMIFVFTENKFTDKMRGIPLRTNGFKEYKEYKELKHAKLFANNYSKGFNLYVAIYNMKTSKLVGVYKNGYYIKRKKWK